MIIVTSLLENFSKAQVQDDKMAYVQYICTENVVGRGAKQGGWGVATSLNFGSGG